MHVCRRELSSSVVPDVAIIFCTEGQSKLGAANAEVISPREGEPEAGLPPGFEGQSSTHSISSHHCLDQGVLVCLHTFYE